MRGYCARSAHLSLSLVSFAPSAGSLAPKWATPEYYAEMDVAYLLQDLHRQIDIVQAVSARSVVADASSARMRTIIAPPNSLKLFKRWNRLLFFIILLLLLLLLIIQLQHLYRLFLSHPSYRHI